MSEPEGPPDEEQALRSSLRRWEWGGVFVFVLLLAAFPMYRAVEGTRREEAQAERDVALVVLGRQLWASNCAVCHGATGEGGSGFPALNSKEFLESTLDEQIHHLIATGIPGTDMPAWWNEFGGPLTDEQIRALVAFIRSWEATAPSRPDWRSPGEPIAPSPSPESSP